MAISSNEATQKSILDKPLEISPNSFSVIPIWLHWKALSMFEIFRCSLCSGKTGHRGEKQKMYSSVMTEGANNVHFEWETKCTTPNF